jgi:hypothetical protein
MSFCLEENKICSNIFLRLTSLVGTYIYIYIYIYIKLKKNTMHPSLTQVMSLG